MIAWFDIDDINKSPARFDFAKLADVNAHYIKAMETDALLRELEACLDAIGTLDELTAEADPKAAPRPDLALLRQANAVRPDIASGKELLAAFHAAGRDRLAAALPSLKERAKTLADLAAGALYLILRRPIVPDAKSKAVLDDATRSALGELIPRLAEVSEWSAPATEAVVRSFAEAKGLKLGKIAQPLRAALTGQSVSPPIFDVLAVLGRDEALSRLRDQAAGP
jgi:glutamyl-tRNA synthetase